MQRGWGCKRISLHMVDHQHIGSESVLPCQGPVGRIAFMINGTQHRAQFIR